jgi:hypothetical protein
MQKVLKLLIEPVVDQPLELVLATSQYQSFWNEQKNNLIAAFYKLTQLQFQQNEIVAKVILGSHANAGDATRAMTLPADHRPLEEKALTLVHELAHRLLGGNALSPIGLGLVPDAKTADPRFQNFEHRHLYLFLYDVVNEALGTEYAELCIKDESQIQDADYQEAWSWAMSMSFEERQHAMKLLARQALPRERWNERDSAEIELRNPEAWFMSLKTS